LVGGVERRDLEDDGDGVYGAVERDLKVAEGPGIREPLGGLLEGVIVGVIAGFQTGGSF
jgi:hypothetical protein